MSEITTDHIQRFLTRVKGMKSEGTHQARKNALKKYDTWLCSREMSVTEVSPLEIEDFLTWLSNNGYAANTIDSYYAAVRLLYKYLVRKDILEANPADDINRSNLNSLTSGTKKHDASVKAYVTKSEKEALVEHTPTPTLRNRLIIRLLWQTGLRRHELATLELDDLDRGERSIKVYSDKTHSARTVYYQPSLDFLLDQWLDGGYRDSYPPAADSPYLIISQRREHIGNDTIGKLVVQAAKNAGIQEVLYEDAAGKPHYRITAHALRHGHAIHSIKSGIDLRRVQQHLGHQNLSTTERYLQFLDEDVKEAYTQFE